MLSLKSLGENTSFLTWLLVIPAILRILRLLDASFQILPPSSHGHILRFWGGYEWGLDTIQTDVVFFCYRLIYVLIHCLQPQDVYFPLRKDNTPVKNILFKLKKTTVILNPYCFNYTYKHLWNDVFLCFFVCIEFFFFKHHLAIYHLFWVLLVYVLFGGFYIYVHD